MNFRCQLHLNRPIGPHRTPSPKAREAQSYRGRGGCQFGVKQKGAPMISCGIASKSEVSACFGAKSCKGFRAHDWLRRKLSADRVVGNIGTSLKQPHRQGQLLAESTVSSFLRQQPPSRIHGRQWPAGRLLQASVHLALAVRSRSRQAASFAVTTAPVEERTLNNTCPSLPSPGIVCPSLTSAVIEAWHH